MNKLRVYNWNPNGTNDLEVVNSEGEVIDGLPEGLFGLDIGRRNRRFVSVIQALRHVAVSPVEDGTTTLKFLQKYFKEGK